MTARRPYDPMPEQKARAQLSTQPGLAVLAEASNATLLTTFAALTHEMHGMHREDAADLRAQRDLVRTEILGRMK